MSQIIEENKNVRVVNYYCSDLFLTLVNLIKLFPSYSYHYTDLYYKASRNLIFGWDDVYKYTPFEEIDFTNPKKIFFSINNAIANKNMQYSQKLKFLKNYETFKLLFPRFSFPENTQLISILQIYTNSFVANVIYNKLSCVFKYEKYDIEQTTNEIVILKELNHVKNIPKVLHSKHNLYNDEFVSITYPYGTPLLEEIKIKNKKLKKYKKEAITILKNIHNSGFVHRDIKPENMIVFENELYIIDFGLTTRIGEKQYDFTGTRLFASENQKKEPNYPEPNDDYVSLDLTMKDLKYWRRRQIQE